MPGSATSRVRVCLYTCRLIKHKLDATMSTNFPLLFLKVYQSWLAESEGLKLRVVEDNHFKNCLRRDITLLVNPCDLPIHLQEKGTSALEFVDLRSVQGNKRLRLLVKPCSAVKTKEVYCSFLCADTIMKTLFGLNPPCEFGTQYFLLEPANPNPRIAEEALLEVYKTPGVRALGEVVVTKLVENFISNSSYFVGNHNSVAMFKAKDLKSRESLCLERNIAIFFTVIFKNQNENDHFGMTIDRKSTRVRISFISSKTLPRNPTCKPACHQRTFNKICSMISKNLRRTEEERVRLQMLLCYEDEDAGPALCRAVAENTGLVYVESSGREMSADTAAATEANCLKFVQNTSNGMPCVWLIRDIHLVVTGRDGELDERVLMAFEAALETLPPSSVIIGTAETRRNIFPKLSRLFVQNFELGSLNREDRENLSRRIADERNIKVENEHLHRYVADKSNGYNGSDLSCIYDCAVSTCVMASRTVVTTADVEVGLETIKRSRSKALGLAEVPCVKWEDVGGLLEPKQQLLQAVSTCGSLGLKQSGILMYGPPGVGKTLLAKAVATECSMSFISVKGPELLNMYVGQSEENVREIFKRAQEAEPCIVFFDELDSLAPSRGQSGDSGGVMDRVVSALLSELDGLENMRVIVLGATNRPDLLDSALLRPGRFDKSIHIGTTSDPVQQLHILEALTRKLTISDDCDLARVVSDLPPGVTGADLSSLVSSAALRTVERVVEARELDKTLDEPLNVTLQDFLEAAKSFEPSTANA